MKLNYVKGNLITLAKNANFDAITHGCNCFNMMGAGIAPQMAQAFECNKMVLEQEPYCGDYNKLGQIEIHLNPKYKGYRFSSLRVINSYTQYKPGANLSYDALEMCMEKINHYCKGMIVGMPKIGCGIAGGEWEVVEEIIISKMQDCKVVIVEYAKNVNTTKLLYV